jgi:hypothetical protein
MSSKEISVNEILDVLFSIMLKQKQSGKTLFYRTLLSLLETDSSSIWPRFEMKSETSLIKEVAEEPISEDIEFDVVVRMPPVKEQKVLVRVKSIEKATLNVVEPEGV